MPATFLLTPLPRELHVANTLTAPAAPVACVAAVCKAADLPAPPPNSAWPGSGCDNVFSGTTCTASCNANYAGTVTSTCTNGVWGPVEGTCILSGTPGMAYTQRTSHHVLVGLGPSSTRLLGVRV